MALTQIKSTLLVPQAVGWVKIARAAASGTSVAFESGIDSTYDHYMITGSDIQSVSNDIQINVTFQTEDAYPTAGYNYHRVENWEGSTGHSASVGNDGGEIAFSYGGTDAGESTSFHCFFSSPDADDNMKAIWWWGIFNGDNYTRQIGGAGNNEDFVTPLTGIKFATSTGDYASGEFALYGLTK